MTQASEVERSVFQRGLLLTGEWGGAMRVARSILARYDNPLRVGESALARGIVQESRAWARTHERDAPPAAPTWQPPAGAPGQLFHALASLPSQQREAWTLIRVEQLGEIDAARAMDCSKTALREVHLAGADATLRPLLGDAYDAAITALRESVRGIDPTAPLADVRRQLRTVVLRKRLLRLLMFLLFAAACATLWWVMTDLHRANDREVERRRLLYEAEQQRYSVPMSPEEKSP
jgi:hypothetical protein